MDPVLVNTVSNFNVSALKETLAFGLPIKPSFLHAFRNRRNKIKIAGRSFQLKRMGCWVVIGLLFDGFIKFAESMPKNKRINGYWALIKCTIICLQMRWRRN